MEGRADASFLGCLGIYVQIYRGCQVLKVGCVLGNLCDSKKWRVSFIVRPSSIRPATFQHPIQVSKSDTIAALLGIPKHQEISGTIRNMKRRSRSICAGYFLVPAAYLPRTR